MTANHVLSDPLLTKREVAALLGGNASEWLVDKLRRTGAITPIRLGHRTVRFRRSDVEQAIRKVAGVAVK